MFEMFRAASDDQTALMGCAAVLLGSGFLMYVSYFIGPVARQERQRQLDLLVQERQRLEQQSAGESRREKAA